MKRQEAARRAASPGGGAAQRLPPLSPVPEQMGWEQIIAGLGAAPRRLPVTTGTAAVSNGRCRYHEATAAWAAATSTSLFCYYTNCPGTLRKGLSSFSSGCTTIPSPTPSCSAETKTKSFTKRLLGRKIYVAILASVAIFTIML